MKYTKPPLTFEQQADQLITRGLIADKSILISKLKAVNYYRLSGYWHPFIKPDNRFKKGTTLQTIWERYTFDRQLRLILIDAIERVEISIRTDLTYFFVHEYGPFNYLKQTTIPNLSNTQHKKLIKDIRNLTSRSQNAFVSHFFQKYGKHHKDLPLWMTTELFTFGITLTFFRGVNKNIKRKVVSRYNVAFGVFESWLFALNTIRNLCAHHERIWNRQLRITPLIPKKSKHPQWHEPVEINNSRIFGILTILKYFMNEIAPQSKWTERFYQLMAKYPNIPLHPMGFPENWKKCVIWKH